MNELVNQESALHQTLRVTGNFTVLSFYSFFLEAGKAFLLKIELHCVMLDVVPLSKKMCLTFVNRIKFGKYKD